MGDAGYCIEPTWHSKPRKIRIICIGAGAAGLLVAYKLRKTFQEYDLQIYDKNPEVGGTWYENRYPGCACDVPAHVYTYSFEPNPNWSQFYAQSPEIQKYFVDFAAKYDLRQYIQFNSRIVSARWIEDQGQYTVKIEREGQLSQDWCDILINATGNLNNWKWPEIPGLRDFQGTLLHSANWDSNVSWANKTVAVIGTGSSAIQIVPQVQKTAKKVVAFMRSVTWIAPPVALDVYNRRKLQATNTATTPAAAPGEQDPPPDTDHLYTAEEQQFFRDHPDEHLAYRKELECAFNGGFDVYLAGSEASKTAQKMFEEEMVRRIGPGHEELKRRLIPPWAPGCRRLTPGEGYLEALVKDNVERVHREIVKITPEGPVDDAGDLHKVDILVCATGFDVSFKPSFKIYGTNGVDMHDEFDPEPHSYLGMAVPKFPNYFTINSVRGSWAVGTALNSQEACIDYILQCVGRIQREGIRAFEVKMEPLLELYEHIDEWHKGSVWNADCKSWYKNNVPGGKLWIWGGSALHYIKTMEYVRWEDYSFRYKNTNRWAFLGNGRVKAEAEKNEAKLTPYIRNSDEPWNIE